jgi:ligand-binding sensor domain-containing protein
MRLLFTLFLVCQCFSVWASGPSARFDRLSIEDGLSQTSIVSILQQKQGFIWIGSYRGGLNRYDRKTGLSSPFGTIRVSPTVSVMITSIPSTKTNKGHYEWVPCGGGLNKYQPQLPGFTTFIFFIIKFCHSNDCTSR